MPAPSKVTDHPAVTPLVLVTGAGGFVGRELCRVLLQTGFRVRGVTRRPVDLPYGAEALEVGEIGPETKWQAALAGVSSIVHLAARVHVMRETAASPGEAFHRVNTAGTETLARAAVEAGVKRLVYVSTVKVNGEFTGDRPFSEFDAPAPDDPYADSKWAAEQALAAIGRATGLETVIVRPPLVYGPGVGGNFLRLMNLIRAGIPLPFGSVRNRRSLVYLGNLVEALVLCTHHPAAAGQTFLISDGQDQSTPELIRRIARAMDKPARLVSFPPGLLQGAGKLIGKRDEIGRLLDSLQVDDGAIRRRLGWSPRYTVEQGLCETAATFRAKAQLR